MQSSAIKGEGASTRPKSDSILLPSTPPPTGYTMRHTLAPAQVLTQQSSIKASQITFVSVVHYLSRLVRLALITLRAVVGSALAVTARQSLHTNDAGTVVLGSP